MFERTKRYIYYVVQEVQKRNMPMEIALLPIIESAYNDAVASARSYEASLKQVEALEESFRATEKRYQNGVVNFVDFQIADNNLFQARSNLVRNKYDYIFKVKILDFYQGKPLEF